MPCIALLSSTHPLIRTSLMTPPRSVARVGKGSHGSTCLCAQKTRSHDPICLHMCQDKVYPCAPMSPCPGTTGRKESCLPALPGRRNIQRGRALARSRACRPRPSCWPVVSWTSPRACWNGCKYRDREVAGFHGGTSVAQPVLQSNTYSVYERQAGGGAFASSHLSTPYGVGYLPTHT